MKKLTSFSLAPKPIRSGDEQAVTYTGGEWPTEGNTEIALPPTAVTLRLVGIIFADVEQIKPAKLPATITSIIIENSPHTYKDGVKVDFPLNKLFEATVDKSKITQLELKGVQLKAVKKDAFTGFSKLQYLILAYSGIKDIDKNTFEAFGTAVDGKPGAFNSAFATLAIQDDKVLSRFPWSSLAPVADSVTVQCLKMCLSKIHSYSQLSFL